MSFVRFCSRASLTLLGALVLLAPLGAVEAKGFSNASSVSRGDFIRTMLQELNREVPQQHEYDLPYKRVPRSLQPYIQVAHDNDALHMFGDDLRLAFPITRGEALGFVAEIQDASSNHSVNYRDVRRGTFLEKAVQVAEENGWMQPLRTKYFGVHRQLTGTHAQQLLNAVQRGGVPQMQTEPESKPSVEKENKVTVPVIRFKPKSEDGSTSVPNAKIMDAVWKIINRDYLYQEKIDSKEAAYQAIESLVKSLGDPYSRFLRPQKAKNFQTQISGEVSGIGAQVEDRDGALTIVTPLSGSPAEKAGIKPNDIVIKVDGEDIQGLGLLEAVEKIRGKKGTPVVLTINRNGVILEITVVRDVVRVPEIKITWQGNVAVVQIMQFGKLTQMDLRDHLTTVQEKNPRGLILDLRNNPGGLLSAANLVLSTVLPKGSEVAIIKTNSTEIVDETRLEPVIESHVPVVVLVNEGSASASEIVAGALQDHGRARVVGKKTFGKGTVQQVLEFIDHSNLKLTIAEWFTPKKRKIDGVGVSPDIEVEYDNDRDSQLIRALELMR